MDPYYTFRLFTHNHLISLHSTWGKVGDGWPWPTVDSVALLTRLTRYGLSTYEIYNHTSLTVYEHRLAYHPANLSRFRFRFVILSMNVRTPHYTANVLSNKKTTKHNVRKDSKDDKKPAEKTKHRVDKEQRCAITTTYQTT